MSKGRHIQFSQIENLRTWSQKGNLDPIFGIDGNLAFNWWYSNNGARICLDGGHLSKADANDDDTHGIGNEFGADTRNGQGSAKWWHMFRDIAMEALVKFRELTMALLYNLMNNLDNMQFLYPKTCQHSLESKLKCML